MHRDVIGLVAFDLVLRVVFAAPAHVAFVFDIAGMDFNDDADCTIITRRNAPEAVVMSLAQYNALMETVHLLRLPANAAHLERSIEQHQRGETIERPLSDAE